MCPHFETSKPVHTGDQDNSPGESEALSLSQKNDKNCKFLFFFNDLGLLHFAISGFFLFSTIRSD